MQSKTLFKMNVAKTICESILSNASNCQILFKSNQISGCEAIRHILTIAKYFDHERSFEKGDRVILMMKDTPEFIYVFLAIICIGGIPVPINPKVRERELAFLLEDSEAKGMVIDEEEFDRVYSIIRHSKYIVEGRMVINGHSRYHPISIQSLGYSFISYDTFPFVEDQKIAFWQYTSGTTGHPKAVQHRQETMLLNAEYFAKQCLKINSTDRIYSVSKMFFGYGLGNSLFFPLLTGASVLVDDEWYTLDRLESRILSFHPTVLFATPKIYNDILEYGSKELREALKSVRLFISAGANLPISLQHRWTKIVGKGIINGMGSTEIGHIFMCNYTNEEITSLNLGKPISGFGVKILSLDSLAQELTQAHEIGELCILPPQNTLSTYWNRAEENQKKYGEGWYRSGDLCARDEYGNYLYHGRKDHLFKINGRWVNPTEVENLLVQHVTAITECVITASSDHQDLPEVLLYVVKQRSYSTVEVELKLRQILNDHVSKYKHPSRIYFVDELPRNSNGKVRISQLTKQEN